MQKPLTFDSLRVPRISHRRILSQYSSWALLVGFGINLWMTQKVFPSSPWLAAAAVACVLLFVGYELSADGTWTRRRLERLANTNEFRVGEQELYTYPLDPAQNEVPRRQTRPARWKVHLVLLLTVILAWSIYIWIWHETPGLRSQLMGLLLVQAYWIYGLIAFAFFAYDVLRTTRWAQMLAIWVAWAVLCGLLTYGAVLQLLNDQRYAFGMGALCALSLFWAYANQRLWVGEQARFEVMRQISVAVLSRDRETPALREDLPRLIQESLRYDNLFIILLTPDRNRLTIVGQAGHYREVRGMDYHLNDAGITTRAVREKRIIECKDRLKCVGNYIQLVDPSEDSTRSEIAVPILHKGVVYGVLDVQGTRRDSFGREDRLVLQSIASALGAALAVNEARAAVSATANLWDEMTMTPHGGSVDEKELFAAFEPFAEDFLGAAPAIYYPLSPTGFPIQAPYFNPEQVHRPEYLTGRITNMRSPLVSLISSWKYYTSQDASSDPLLTRGFKPDEQTFIHREQIRSCCFVPVGYVDEPLGALFLNFRYHKEFDDQFRLTVASFANAIGLAAWRARYEKMILNGFGRPELYVHNVVARYGLKLGFRAKLDQITNADGSIDMAGLHNLFDQTEVMINDIRQLEAAVPPSFRNSNQTLRTRLENFSAPFNSAVHYHIDPRIEKANPIVLIAIYALITEAINNAFFHAKADQIDVLVRRESSTIDVRIQNNGELLEVKKTDTLSGRHGINYLRSQFKEHFGADFAVRPGDNDQGGVVMVRIPAIPYSNRGHDDE